jgi:hypothetical protein
MGKESACSCPDISVPYFLQADARTTGTHFQVPNKFFKNLVVEILNDQALGFHPST